MIYIFHGETSKRLSTKILHNKKLENVNFTPWQVNK